MEYDEWSAMPNSWMRKGTSAYNNERELYEVLQMESFNHNGVQMVYYPVTNVSDKLFGEDNNQTVVRRFDFMCRYELPNEGRNVGVIGITTLDNFPIYVSIMHFNYASTFDSFGLEKVNEKYIPKIGDLLYAKYNKTVYRITMVKAEDNIFLQGKHTYTFQVEVFKDKEYNFSSEIKDANVAGTDELLTVLFGSSTSISRPDIYNITDQINKEKKDILYEKKPNECETKDPFNNWWSD